VWPCGRNRRRPHLHIVRLSIRTGNFTSCREELDDEEDEYTDTYDSAPPASRRRKKSGSFGGTMPTTSPGSAASPAELKDMGNKLYTQRKYDEAIECYSAAIGKNSSVPTYFTNRALCYLKKSQWDLVIKDCKRALDLDSNLVKAHFFMGQALQELDAMDECVACLQRASDLARENKQHFGDDIAMATRIAKRKRWNALEERRIAEEIELQTYMNKLLREEMERQLKQLNLGVTGGHGKATATTTTTAIAANVSKSTSSSSSLQPTPAPTASSSTSASESKDSSSSNESEEKNNQAATVIENEESQRPQGSERTNAEGDGDGSDEDAKDEAAVKSGGNSSTSSPDETSTGSKDTTDSPTGDSKSDRGATAELNCVADSAGVQTEIINGCVNGVADHAAINASIAASETQTHVHSLTPDEVREKKRAIEDYHAKMEAELNSLFSEIDDRRKKREVPDYLCGKISFDILRDPVITPSGITYERRDIEEHIQRVGHFDPVTRVTLTQDQLVPNFALKDVVDAFVAENAWAVDF